MDSKAEPTSHEKVATDHKADVRSRVFAVLRTVAFPDSSFHFDFGEFIADFHGSDQAVDRTGESPRLPKRALHFSLRPTTVSNSFVIARSSTARTC